MAIEATQATVRGRGVKSILLVKLGKAMYQGVNAKLYWKKSFGETQPNPAFGRSSGEGGMKGPTTFVFFSLIVNEVLYAPENFS